MSLPSSPDRGWHLAWAGVFVANSIVPLWLGWEVTRRGGWVGMVAATAATFLFGFLVGPRWRSLRITIVAGGTVTAPSQVFPLVQIAAGVLSLRAVDSLGFEPDEGLGNSHSLTDPGAFLVTLLTAGLLQAAAFACGTVVRATGRAVDRQIERKVRERREWSPRQKAS